MIEGVEDRTNIHVQYSVHTRVFVSLQTPHSMHRVALDQGETHTKVRESFFINCMSNSRLRPGGCCISRRYVQQSLSDIWFWDVCPPTHRTGSLLENFSCTTELLGFSLAQTADFWLEDLLPGLACHEQTRMRSPSFRTVDFPACSGSTIAQGVIYDLRLLSSHRGLPLRITAVLPVLSLDR